MNSSKPYRENVGVILFNSKAQVLTGERVGYPGNFQFPQGGTDDDEPLTAARREVQEEVGLELTTPPLFEYPEWLLYDFPADIPAKLKKYAGQKQKWYYWYWNGDARALDLTTHEQEFITVRWADFDWIIDQIVPFKQETYQKLYEFGWPRMQEHIKNL